MGAPKVASSPLSTPRSIAGGRLAFAAVGLATLLAAGPYLSGTLLRGPAAPASAEAMPVVEPVTPAAPAAERIVYPFATRPLPKTTAKFADHWAYQPISNPEPPGVRNPGWARNGIDLFIQAKLEAEGLSPAPEADR
ncbi:MAG: hypothetical protein NTU45_00370, partial [Planctomycetota bacterium]|nr:hypothetical protein [Planctomycetota bacterium]